MRMHIRQPIVVFLVWSNNAQPNPRVFDNIVGDYCDIQNGSLYISNSSFDEWQEPMPVDSVLVPKGTIRIIPLTSIRSMDIQGPIPKEAL